MRLEPARASAEGRLFLLGALLVFASALCYAVYLVAGSQVVKRVGSMRFTAYSMVVATVPAVLQFFVLEPAVSAGAAAARVWIYAIMLATLQHGAAGVPQAEALKRIGANQFALIGALGPVQRGGHQRARPGRAVHLRCRPSAARWSSSACCWFRSKRS